MAVKIRKDIDFVIPAESLDLARMVSAGPAISMNLDEYRLMILMYANHQDGGA
ncbi:MAG: hypothetical protein R3C56_29745 [Pirellulaceae bacterium]